MMRRVSNPPNPYESRWVEWLEPPPPVAVEVYEESARSILSKNDSPDLPFRWSVNPYRGCQHACAYCYARPYHEYLGLGAGTDFDAKLIVKTNAAELLEAAFRRRSWKRELVMFSGVTDCYQPLEAVWGLTRRCLEVCLRYANPVAVVTKGSLVMRDADLLADLNLRTGATVYVSIAFCDDRSARLIEPQAPPPSKRFEAIRRLSERGVPVGVFVAPVIPGLNECEIPEILRRAAECGARWASMTALRLPGPVERVFLERIQRTLPMRAKRIERRLRDIRRGEMNDSRMGHRMTGSGVYWSSIRQLFDISVRRVGLSRTETGAVDCREGESTAPYQMTFGF